MALWTSPVLRGPDAAWRRLPVPMFESNHTIFGAQGVRFGESHEFVTPDFFGAAPGGASADWRVLLSYVKSAF